MFKEMREKLKNQQENLNRISKNKNIGIEILNFHRCNNRLEIISEQKKVLRKLQNLVLERWKIWGKFRDKEDIWKI